MQEDLFRKQPIVEREQVHTHFCRFCGAQTRRANHIVEGCVKCGDKTSDICIPCFLNEQ